MVLVRQRRLDRGRQKNSVAAGAATPRLGVALLLLVFLSVLQRLMQFLDGVMDGLERLIIFFLIAELVFGFFDVLVRSLQLEARG